MADKSNTQPLFFIYRNSVSPMFSCWVLAVTLAIGQMTDNGASLFPPLEVPPRIQSPSSVPETVQEVKPFLFGNSLEVSTFLPAEAGGPEDQEVAKKEPKRRALPAPLQSLPLPSSEWQGYPLIGVPFAAPVYPLMKALQGTFYGDLLNSNKIRVYGWVDMGGNLSTSKNSNVPLAYGIVPNSVQLDQFILRFERVEDTVQTDHFDWGFRFTQLYGMDYRYTTALGYFSNQLLQHNNLYGYDPLEIYGELYVPWIGEGTVLRLGRFISPPDIEAQLAPDNYLYSHSLLYTFDAYTHTGLLASTRLNPQTIVQLGIHAGNDVAPWTSAAQLSGFAGWRWVSKDNNDSIYTCLDCLNNAHFSNPTSTTSAHDNFNYIVSTWSHRFNERVSTNTEAYYMWQFNALSGGTPSFGPVRSFGGGGGAGAMIPGLSSTWGAVNYTMFVLDRMNYLTIRNEYWDDMQGERTGSATLYTSHTIGWAHHFSENLQVRPEFEFMHSYQKPAFDNGTKKNQFVLSVDLILRF